ncbi:MAG: DUF2393 family protein [Acidobacteriota bacterium]|nr:DUF2393 family protein [Acidobacteriota bacterium]
MSEQQPIPAPGSASKPETETLFRSRQPEQPSTSLAVWGVAGAVVLVVVLGLVMLGRRSSGPALNVIQPLAGYAGSLPLTQLAMSESTSLSGGKSTYIDGHIQNTGSQTVSSVTVQAIFRNDEQMPPQVETVPLMLIRTHEPYIDTQSVAAAPLKPGDDREFRLIFESLPGNWNMQMPEIHIVQAATK